MKFKFLFIAGIITISFFSCKENKWPCLHAKGNVITNIIDNSGFKKINFETEGTVYLKYDSVYSITITASENIIDKIVFETSGDALNIYSKRCLGDQSDVVINISSPEINSISISGSGVINTLDSIYSDYMNFQVSGSGSINANAVSNNTTAKISGSGSITLNGISNNLDVDISGSGDVHAFHFFTKTCSVDISGSGNAEVNAIETLGINISGSGNVYYQGSPKLTINVSGSGSIVDSN